MPKIIKIEYDRNDRKSTKYVLDCSPNDKGGDLVGLDITKTLDDDNKGDRDSGHARDTGPAFAFSVHRAIQAGYLHEDATAGWNKNPSEVHRPTIGFPGTWRIFKREHAKVLREWKMDRTFE